MSVYVDTMRAPLGRMIMCHMVADSSLELHKMADHIGVARRWVQAEGTYREHYDISAGKRVLAVHAGAKVVSTGEFGRILLSKRRALALPQVVPHNPVRH